jgi:hypothetical protein
VITWLQPCNTRTNFFNYTGTFVAANQWKFKWQVASPQVFVTVAHTRRCDFDENFAFFWWIKFDFFD